MTNSCLQTWLTQVGMADFKPSGPAYRCDRRALLVALRDLPSANLCSLADAAGARILEGIKSGADIPPVTLGFSLLDGHHRVAISRALGFTHVPAWWAP